MGDVLIFVSLKFLLENFAAGDKTLLFFLGNLLDHSFKVVLLQGF